MRPIYRKDEWVLCRCACGRENYVEPHGTTASCRCSPTPTEHTPIPYEDRVNTVNGPYRKPKSKAAPKKRRYLRCSHCEANFLVRAGEPQFLAKPGDALPSHRFRGEPCPGVYEP